MFRCYSYTIIRERINLRLLKLQLLKYSIKIHQCVVSQSTTEQCNVQAPIRTQYMQPQHHLINHLSVRWSFYHSPPLCTFSCHPSPATILPSSLNSSCRLFLGLPLNLFVPKFIYNTLLGILFPSILCTCPNQRNLFNLIVSIIVGFVTLA